MFDLENLETLLMQKSYGELTESERAMISRHIASESEYNDLRETLLNVKKTFTEEKIVLVPSPRKKEALLKKFEAVHGKGGNTSATGRSPKKFLISPFYRYAGIAATLILAVALVWNEYRQKPRSENPLAVNQDKTVVPEFRAPEGQTEEAKTITEEEPVPETTTASGKFTEMPGDMISAPGTEEVPPTVDEITYKSPVSDEKTVTSFRDQKEENRTETKDLAAEREDFYVKPNEATNMYHVYESDQNSKFKKRTIDTSGKTRKEEKTSYQTKGYMFNPYKTSDKDDTRSQEKRALRKSIIYSDL